MDRWCHSRPDCRSCWRCDSSEWGGSPINSQAGGEDLTVTRYRLQTSNQTRAVETLKGEPSSFVTFLKLFGVIRLVIMASSRWMTLAVNFPCWTKTRNDILCQKCFKFSYLTPPHADSILPNCQQGNCQSPDNLARAGASLAMYLP